MSIQNFDGMRDRARAHLENAFVGTAKSQCAPLAKPVVTENARRLEVCVFNWTQRAAYKWSFAKNWLDPRFRANYTQKIMSMAYNIKASPTLMPRLESGDVDYEWMASAMPMDLFSGGRRASDGPRRDNCGRCVSGTSTTRQTGRSCVAVATRRKPPTSSCRPARPTSR